MPQIRYSPHMMLHGTFISFTAFIFASLGSIIFIEHQKYTSDILRLIA